MQRLPHFDAAPSSRPIGRGALPHKTKSLMYSRRRESQTIGEPGVTYPPIPKIKKSMSTKSQFMVKEVREERIGTWFQAWSKPTSAPMLEPFTLAFVNAAAAPAMNPMRISNIRKINKIIFHLRSKNDICDVCSPTISLFLEKLNSLLN